MLATNSGPLGGKADQSAFARVGGDHHDRGGHAPSAGQEALDSLDLLAGLARALYEDHPDVVDAETFIATARREGTWSEEELSLHRETLATLPGVEEDGLAVSGLAHAGRSDDATVAELAEAPAAEISAVGAPAADAGSPAPDIESLDAQANPARPVPRKPRMPEKGFVEGGPIPGEAAAASGRVLARAASWLIAALFRRTRTPAHPELDRLLTDRLADWRDRRLMELMRETATAGVAVHVEATRIRRSPLNAAVRALYAEARASGRPVESMAKAIQGELSTSIDEASPLADLFREGWAEPDAMAGLARLRASIAGYEATLSRLAAAARRQGIDSERIRSALGNHGDRVARAVESLPVPDSVDLNNQVTLSEVIRRRARGIDPASVRRAPQAPLEGPRAAPAFQG